MTTINCQSLYEASRLADAYRKLGYVCEVYAHNDYNVDVDISKPPRRVVSQDCPAE